MSDFFEPPPRPEVPEPPRYRMPPWFGPPRGTLPGIVPFERVIVQTDKVAVCATRLAAYPTGFEFDIVTMTAEDDHEIDPMLFHEQHHWRHRASGADEIPAELLRFGVQFADGSKATNLDGFEHHPGRTPSGPVMHAGGGGGGSGSWHQSLWVWPLPPPGPLTFVCEWPAMNIPITRVDLDADAIIDAAARACVVFSDEHLPEWSDDDDGPEVTVIR